MEEKNKDIVIDGQQETLLFQDVCSIIEHGRQQAYGSVSHIAIATYWNVGKRIVEEEQNGEKRAAYGIGLMKNLSESFMVETIANETLIITRSSIYFFLSQKK